MSSSRLHRLGTTVILGASFAAGLSVPLVAFGAASTGAGSAHGHGESAAAATSDSHAAGSHDAGSHDAGSHDTGSNATVPDADRCDLGFNTAKFNDKAKPGMPHAHGDTEQVDFTLEEWADVFVDPKGPIPKDVVLGYFKANPAMAGGVLSGGLTHTLAPDPWNPLTDPAECKKLAGELSLAQATAAKYATVADAEKAGYRKVTDYYPGIAAHYMHFGLVDDKFAVDKPEMLLFDGSSADSHVVGLSYYIIKPGDTEPEVGFTANNDHYHVHLGLCMKDGVVVAGSNTSPEECAALGGKKAAGGAGWMSHAWVVPGCESDWGVFSGANPKLPVLGAPGSGGGGMKIGCGTGKKPTDTLQFETSDYKVSTQS